MALYEENMRLLKIIALILPVLVASCDPCYELATKICEAKYETNETKEACLRQLDVRSSQNSLDAAKREDVCQAVLDSGKCITDAIRRNDVDSCGMTRKENRAKESVSSEG